jgi:hypothetical protein
MKTMSRKKHRTRRLKRRFSARWGYPLCAAICGALARDVLGSEGLLRVCDA